MQRSVHTDKHQRLIALMTKMREEAGMTQVQLATTLGRPQSYISKVERGERRLDVVEFCEWIAALGASPSSTIEGFLRS